MEKHVRTMQSAVVSDASTSEIFQGVDGHKALGHGESEGRCTLEFLTGVFDNLLQFAAAAVSLLLEFSARS